jgi:site-specific DNA-cytosine methylase
VLLENVKSEIATWDDIVSQWDKIGYEAAWVICDTKNYYLPQTRLRMYMMAINRSHCGKGAAEAVGRWKELMRKMERQCSSPYEAFLPDSLKESSGYGTLRSEPDWALCKLRNDHIRSEKRLGILSPISRRSGNGTVM